MSDTLSIYDYDFENSTNACAKCRNAIWQSYYDDGGPDVVEFTKMRKDDLKFACFCTIMHTFIQTERFFCDGNRPLTEPELEDFIDSDK